MVAVATVVFAAAIGLHESAHAVVAWLAGGDPSLLSSTDLRGDFTQVSRLGLLAIGVAGSAANWLLALGSLALLAVAGSGPARSFAWLSAGVNGLIPAVYMVASPLLGFGDWSTVLRRFEPGLPLRAITAAIGLALAVVWVRVCARRLAPFLSPLPRAARRALLSNLARTTWLTGGGLAITAALLSPLSLQWALPIAAGSTLGTTWPLIPMADRAVALAETVRSEAGASGLSLEASPGWLAGGAVAAVGFVGLLGPGIRI